MSAAPKKPRRLRRFVFRMILLTLVAAAVYVPIRNYQQRQTAARLERIRDGLREELAQLLENDPRLAGAPEGGVLIGAPAAFTARLAHQVASGLLERTEIRLTNKRVRKRETVRVKTFLGKDAAPGTMAWTSGCTRSEVGWVPRSPRSGTKTIVRW